MDLTAEQVSRRFFRKRGDSNVFYAVEPVDLTVPAGKIICLAGPSGSGKTTMLSMLAGILRPTGGTVRLGETDLYQMEDRELSRFRNRHFGVIPQGQTVLQALNVLENVMLPCMLTKKDLQEKISSGVTMEQLHSRALSLLERTGIADLQAVMPSELSGGELRRMSIARAMMQDPEVILADEPTADLDAENTAIVLSLLRETADEGKAVLIVTHDRDVMDFADTVYHMNQGKIQDQ